MQTETSSATPTATYTKLEDGTWGVRVNSSRRLAEGDVLTVSKRDGSSKTERVAKVLWHGVARDGREASLVTIAATSRSPQRGGSGRSGRGTWTGCHCGSVEEYSRPSDCWSCRHDAE